jgi:hypothetical protein
MPFLAILLINIELVNSEVLAIKKSNNKNSILNNSRNST